MVRPMGRHISASSFSGSGGTVTPSEAATLREPERVEAVARGTLAMDVPDPSRVVSIGQRSGRRPSGRMR